MAVTSASLQLYAASSSFLFSFNPGLAWSVFTIKVGLCFSTICSFSTPSSFANKLMYFFSSSSKLLSAEATLHSSFTRSTFSFLINFGFGRGSKSFFNNAWASLVFLILSTFSLQWVKLSCE